MKQGLLKGRPKKDGNWTERSVPRSPNLSEPRERRTGVQAHNTGKGPHTQKGQTAHPPPMNPFMYRHKGKAPDESMAPMQELKQRVPKRKFKNT